MKNKFMNFLYVIIIFATLLNFGFNIYFLTTTSKSSSGLFNSVSDSILELKAETDDIGTSYGSAVVFSAEGLIITNAHVITYKKLNDYHTFDKISVRFINEENYRTANIVKYDLNLDLAILKLENKENFNYLKFGNDSNLKFGDKVYAIGNMSNYGISITTGYVSIPHINVSYNGITRNVIQCDLTISDGNSGGALIDEKGNLIGITTFRLKDLSNNIIYGISYSVPANTILKYIKN